MMATTIRGDLGELILNILPVVTDFHSTSSPWSLLTLEIPGLLRAIGLFTEVTATAA